MPYCSSQKARIAALYKGFLVSELIAGKGQNAEPAVSVIAIQFFQARIVGRETAARRDIDETYRVALANIPGLTPLEKKGQTVSNYAYFPILVTPDYPMSRDGIYQKLRDNNIMTRRYFYPLIPDFPMYRQLSSAKPENLPVATELAQQILCLPIYPGLASADIERIVSILSSASRQDTYSGPYVAAE